MSVGPGTRLGPYEITAKLGEGGMGEVWRAHDVKLKREVAIKVLPQGFTEDKERLQRFEREAQLLAQLNHPNIAQIYGMEASGESHALVMELVEGPTLAERLEQGPLPLNESLSLARQIAEALEEAHEKGIIHRDLKPQNIKASIEGKIKVLDFGLAKAMDPTGAASGAGSASQLAASPTLTLGATVQGMILGTAAYMAPEQAKGFAVDKRADIWAFGVVLFEMLTGRSLFAGDSVPDTLARVIQREIDFESLPKSTPPAIRRLLRRCLERKPKNRLHDIADARLVIDDAVEGRNVETVSEPAPAPEPRFAWLPWAIAAALAVALVATLVLALGGRFGSGVSTARPLVRTSLLIPEEKGFTWQTGGSSVLSPDGSAVVFVVEDAKGSALYLQELAATEARPLPGTEGAILPFWSPDSRQIAFFAPGALRRVPRAGGAVQTICPANDTRGGTWGPDGTIVFSQGFPGALYRVPAAGGTAVAATRLDADAKEQSHRFPTFLPDGRHVLFGVLPADDAGRMPIKIASLDQVSSGRPLLTANSVPSIAPSGELVFVRDAALVSQTIDFDRLEMVGEARQLADRPERTGGYSGAPLVSLSDDGKMLYAPYDDRPSELVFLDRGGNRLGGGRQLACDCFNFLLSHRGDRFATVRREADETQSIWLFDLAGEDGVRVSPPGTSASGVLLWSPDDREVLAQLHQGGADGRPTLMRLTIESGASRLLQTRAGHFETPVAWSSDGKIVVYDELVEGQRRDIGYLALDADEERTSYLATPSDEHALALSPDDRWLVYQSDVSGRPETYVDSFPRPSGARRVASGLAVFFISFRADGKELLMGVLDGGGAALYSSELRLGESIEIGAPRRLFTVPADNRAGGPMPGFDRFALLLPIGQRPKTLTLVDNWRRQLEPTQ